jgi:hypothetical protein
MPRTARNAAWLLAAVAISAWVYVTRDEPKSHAPEAPTVISNATDAVVEPLALPASESSDRASAAEVPAAPSPEAKPAVSPNAPIAAGTGRIYGRIVLPDGSPAAARKLQMKRVPGGPERSIFSNDAGRFDERGLRAGKWVLSTTLSGRDIAALGLPPETPLFELASARTVHLEANSEVEVELGRPPDNPIRVTGYVHVDPAEDIVLAWTRERKAGLFGATWKRVAPDGRYAIVLDAAGTYDVALIVGESLRMMRTVDVPDVREFVHNFELDRRGIHGRLRTPDGEPITGARVELTLRGGHRPFTPLSALSHVGKTDVSELFEFDYLDSARYALSICGGKSKRSGNASPIVVPDLLMTRGGEPIVLDLVAESGRPVFGRVVHESGEGARSVSVFVFDSNGDPINSLSPEFASREGGFLLPALGPGRHTLIGARGSQWTDPVVIDVPANGGLERVELRLRKAARLDVRADDLGDAWIDVRDANGNCLSGLLDKEIDDESLTDDQSGSTWSYFVPAGTYDLRAIDRVGVVASARVTARAGETQRVTLERR